MKKLRDIDPIDRLIFFTASLGLFITLRNHVDVVNIVNIFIPVISFTAIIFLLNKHLIIPFLEKKKLNLAQKEFESIVSRLVGYISLNNWGQFKYEIEGIKKYMSENENTKHVYQRLSLDLFVAIGQEKKKDHTLAGIWLDYAKEMQEDARAFVQTVAETGAAETSLLVRLGLAYMDAERVIIQASQ